LAREVLSNKFGHFEIYRIFAAPGLVSYHGEKWTKHRRIVNPAFHMEKLKVTHGHHLFFLKPFQTHGDIVICI